MSGKYDGYQGNIETIEPLATYVRCGAHVTHILITASAAQTPTVVKNALNSGKETSTSYNDLGKLECLYLRGGVSECERIETSLSKEMVVMGIGYLKVSR